MVNTLSISQARSRFLSMPEELEKGAEPATMAVTRRGKPVLAILPWELYESVMETLEILGDSGLMRQVRQGLKEARAGKGLPWDSVKRRHGL